MKNKMDALLREKINNLDTVPPGLTRDEEAGWEKIKKNQKAIERKTDFVKKTAWGMMLAAFVAGAFLFYGTEKSEVVNEVKRKVYTASVNKKSETPLQEHSVAVNPKPNSLKRKMTPEKVAALPASTDTSSIILLVPIDTVKLSANKEEESDTIIIPRAPGIYFSPIGNTLEEDFRLDTFLKKDFILNVQEKNESLKDRNDKKKGRLGKERKTKLKK